MFYQSYCVRGKKAPYRAIFKYKDDDGKWHQTSRTLSASTKREAQREAKELHMKLEDEEGLSGVLITELTPEHVQRWETQLLEHGLSPRTVRKAHVLLKAACGEAVYDELIPKNPLKRIRPLKVARPMPNSLTDAQRRKLLTYLDMAADAPFNLAVQIALMTGMRQGEICGLRLGDVDFVGKNIPARHLSAHQLWE